MDTVLKTTELTKVFSGKKAVDHVSMTVNRGDIYGFIGKNVEFAKSRYVFCTGYIDFM